MNDDQRNRLAMFKTTRDYLTEESAIWNGIPAHVTAHTKLSTNIADIDDMVTSQGAVITGHTDTKEALRETLHGHILLVANATANHARATGNLTLLAEVDLTPSDLVNESMQTIDDVAVRVVNSATPVLADLADYGIVLADIVALETATAAFETAKTSPAVKRAQRKGLTEALKPLLSETSALLDDQMDTMMARYKTSHPAFHAGYLGARTIIDLHGPGDDDEDPVPDPDPDPVP